MASFRKECTHELKRKKAKHVTDLVKVAQRRIALTRECPHAGCPVYFVCYVFLALTRVLGLLHIIS